jgi:hypothetical protein
VVLWPGDAIWKTGGLNDATTFSLFYMTLYISVLLYSFLPLRPVVLGFISVRNVL